MLLKQTLNAVWRKDAHDPETCLIIALQGPSHLDYSKGGSVRLAKRRSVVSDLVLHAYLLLWNTFFADFEHGEFVV